MYVIILLRSYRRFFKCHMPIFINHSTVDMTLLSEDWGSLQVPYRLRRQFSNNHSNYGYFLSTTTFINLTKYLFSRFYCRGIILYLEYHNVCPFVRIASPPPPPIPLASVSSPLEPKGGGGEATLACGWGEPIMTTGEKALDSVYSVAFFFFLLGSVLVTNISESGSFSVCQWPSRRKKIFLCLFRFLNFFACWWKEP